MGRIGIAKEFPRPEALPAFPLLSPSSPTARAGDSLNASGKGGDWLDGGARRGFLRLLLPLLGFFTALAGGLLATPALACRGPTLERTIFFDDIPDGIGSDVVAHVTLTEVAADPFWQRGTARVNAVSRGALPGKTVIIVAPASSCDRRLAAGSEGMVIGALRQAPGGAFELVVRTESFHERELRAQQGKKK